MPTPNVQLALEAGPTQSSLFNRAATDSGLELSTQTGLGTYAPDTMAERIIGVFLGVLALVAVSFIVYAGYRWLTSGGNEDTIEKAKKTLIAACIGLAIILGAYGITLYVFSILFRATGTQPGAQEIDQTQL